MEYVFSRKTGQGVLSIVLGLVFIYMGFNQNPASPFPDWLKYALGILSLIYGGGQVAYPLCVVTTEHILVRINPFVPKSISLNSLSGIEIGDNQITLYYDQEDRLSLAFRHVNQDTKEKMIQAFEALKKH